MGAYGNGAALDIFYVDFLAIGEIHPVVSEFSRVKEALIYHFGDREDAQDFIQNEMDENCHERDHIGCLGETDGALDT